MESVTHWTQGSVADFVYSISSNFVAQLEVHMEEKGISKGELATRLNRTSGRVSQVFNDPGNLSLRTLVEYARALGMKVGVIAYDDGDSGNHNGPIDPNVFVSSWQALNSPRDLFEVAATEIIFQCGTAISLSPKTYQGNQYVVVGAEDILRKPPEASPWRLHHYLPENLSGALAEQTPAKTAVLPAWWNQKERLEAA